ncbi:hypothetical protein NN561_015896 [Cricetulus griseus]
MGSGSPLSRAAAALPGRPGRSARPWVTGAFPGAAPRTRTEGERPPGRFAGERRCSTLLLPRRARRVSAAVAVPVTL